MYAAKIMANMNIVVVVEILHADAYIVPFSLFKIQFNVRAVLFLIGDCLEDTNQRPKSKTLTIASKNVSVAAVVEAYLICNVTSQV